MERLGAGRGSGLGVGVCLPAGGLPARRVAGTRAAARRHAGRAGACFSIGVGGWHRALFYLARVGALYSGGAGEHRRLAGVEHVLLGVSGGVGGVVLVFVSGGFEETHRRSVGRIVILQTTSLGYFVLNCVGGVGMFARLGDHGVPLEFSGRVATGIHAACDAGAIYRRARRFAGGGVGSVGGLLLVGRWRDEKKFKPPIFKELAGPAVLVAVAVGLGSFALAQPLGEERGELKIALIQPSIPQRVLWSGNPEDQHNRFAQLMDLSDIAVDENPDLLVWPEASVPPLRLLDPEVVEPRLEKLNAALREKKIWRVWGADRFESNAPLNSSVLMDPDGNELAYYSKQHLVMFGEYVPFGEQLPFLKKLAPVGNFARGKGPEIFDMGHAKMSVIICFEDVVPALARRAATPEVDFLLNLTNDGWFGQSHQQWQHARSAAWRAIETRRPLVRCTNNGITCWVDEHGRFHGVGDRRLVYSPAYKIVSIPLRKGPRALTFYQRTGDWLPWGTVLACGVLIFLRRKNGSATGAIPVN